MYRSKLFFAILIMLILIGLPPTASPVIAASTNSRPLQQVDKDEIDAYIHSRMQIADVIIKAQQSEIDQMNAWRKAWYPDLAPTGGMEMSMGDMAVKEGSEPYDVRFIAAMIPHHESAITMAQQAKQRAEHAEIKQLADTIIAAQTGEITQMKQWYQTWTGTAYSGSM